MVKHYQIVALRGEFWIADIDLEVPRRRGFVIAEIITSRELREDADKRLLRAGVEDIYRIREVRGDEVAIETGVAAMAFESAARRAYGAVANDAVMELGERKELSCCCVTHRADATGARDETEDTRRVIPRERSDRPAPVLSYASSVRR
jgi:hypothetical protein